jgi:hypothetical protein
MDGVILVEMDWDFPQHLLMDLLVVAVLVQQVLMDLQLSQLLVRVVQVFNFQQHLEILCQE